MKHSKLVLTLGIAFTTSAAFGADPASGNSTAISGDNIRHITLGVETQQKNKDDLGKAAIIVNDKNAKTNNKNGLANNQPETFAKFPKIP